MASLFAFVACEYDDSALWDEIRDHESRIVKLETLCNQMNTNITSLQTIVSALQKNDYVTGIAPIMEGGNELGYTITFSVSGPVTIYHGKNGSDGKDGKDGVDGKDGQNGQDGKDGQTPVIGVKQDTDGIYYWTLNGEWLLDDNGNKIKAVGIDGKDGEDGIDGKDGIDGEDGKNGIDGEDGITPKLKIEDDYWYVSYDNGLTWTRLGKATSESTTSTECLFKGVTEDSQYVYITLNDNSVIILTKKAIYDTLESLGVPPDDEIWYTTHYGKLIISDLPDSDLKIISNKMVNGKGIIKFNKPINTLKWSTEINYNLRFVSLPESIIQLSDSVIDGPTYAPFMGMYYLEGVRLPSSLKSIGYFSFESCISLEEIIIPESVVEIGQAAFGGCCSLNKVYLRSTTPPRLLDDYVFKSESDIKFFVPMESVEAYKAADKWSKYATDIVGYEYN